MVKAVTFKLNAQGALYAVVKLTETERIRIASGERLTVKVV